MDGALCMKGNMRTLNSCILFHDMTMVVVLWKQACLSQVGNFHLKILVLERHWQMDIDFIIRAAVIASILLSPSFYVLILSIHHVLSRIQLYVTPWTCSPPGSSIHGIFPARILEWVAISFPRGSSQPSVQTRVFCLSCISLMMLLGLLVGPFYSRANGGSEFPWLAWSPSSHVW